MYEAKTLLHEMGGPDLRDKDDKPGKPKRDEDEDQPPDEDDGEESVIEIND